MTMREKGTGLGLAIVKKIVDDHGAYDSIARCPQSDVDERQGCNDHGSALDANDRQRRQTERRTRRTSEREPASWRLTFWSLMTKPTFARSSPAFSMMKDMKLARRQTAIRHWRPSPIGCPRLIFLDIWLQGSRLDGLALA
jgi:hypothetical protein